MLSPHGATLRRRRRNNSADLQYPGAIPVQKWSWEADNQTIPDSGSAERAGKLRFDEFKFTKAVDATTPAFLAATANATTSLGAVRVSVRSGGQGAGPKPTPYLELCLQHAWVTADSLDHSDGDDTVTENVTVSFGTLTERYTSYDSTGKPLMQVAGGWDTIGNLPIGGFSSAC